MSKQEKRTTLIKIYKCTKSREEIFNIFKEECKHTSINKISVTINENGYKGKETECYIESKYKITKEDTKNIKKHFKDEEELDYRPTKGCTNMLLSCIRDNERITSFDLLEEVEKRLTRYKYTKQERKERKKKQEMKKEEELNGNNVKIVNGFIQINLTNYWKKKGKKYLFDSNN